MIVAILIVIVDQALFAVFGIAWSSGAMPVVTVSPDLHLVVAVTPKRGGRGIHFKQLPGDLFSSAPLCNHGRMRYARPCRSPLEHRIGIFLSLIRHADCMALSFLDKIVGFLLRPSETFRAVRGESLTDAAVYYLLLLIFTSVLAGVMVYLGFSGVDGSALGITLGPSAGIMSFVWALIFIYVWGLFTLVVWAVVLQIGAKALGGRGEFDDAFKTAVYAQTPFLLLGWIPVVGWLLTQLWAVALTVIGVRELYGVETGKAAAVAVVALVLYLLVSWILFILGYATAIGLAGIMGLTA